MDRILIFMKNNDLRASSAPILELFSVVFKLIYWYIQQISGEHLQDHWSSGLTVTSVSLLLHKAYTVLTNEFVCMYFIIHLVC